eukprot:CAMPEP_0171455732 /NCGR_PEP_ID=MMETSP0945-20130129/2510_1 /TAXON_ID=109269 /ORGANISM="Vaucheria litorea, Strain CCMP2940" /LENGTH=155 /DNA_ID=CAMNT_0011981033 /DNA_START=16 /DNA_END=483 /DNA_ORIENTATION=+
MSLFGGENFHQNDKNERNLLSILIKLIRNSKIQIKTAGKVFQIDELINEARKKTAQNKFEDFSEIELLKAQKGLPIFLFVQSFIILEEWVKALCSILKMKVEVETDMGKIMEDILSSDDLDEMFFTSYDSIEEHLRNWKSELIYDSEDLTKAFSF